MKQQEEKET